jgi:hypothetical protein
VLYRGLSPDEDPAQGISPNFKGKYQTPANHVRFGSRPWYRNQGSQFISSSKTLAAALRFSNRVIKFDASKVDGSLIDVSTEEGRLEIGLTPNDKRAWANATRNQEVIIDGRIPPDAILDVIIQMTMLDEC